MTRLSQIRDDAKRCTDCPLYKHATQTVFGEGPAGAKIVLVGEQPGDQEDLAGKPFVGPAGRILGKAMAEAGIDESSSDDALLDAMVKHPILMNRPIVVTPKGAKLCRPSETVAEIL